MGLVGTHRDAGGAASAAGSSSVATWRPTVHHHAGRHCRHPLGGAYRYNGKAIAAEGVGWDAVTLLLVIPAGLSSLPFLARGSLRAALFTAGILAYFVYQYFEYAMALAYGPFFALYVAIGALSLTALAVILGGIDLVELRARVGEGSRADR